MKKIYFLMIALTISVMNFGQTPIITAIVDGDCSGGNPKLLEIYADGEVDFSLYSLENQPNANTTWGSTQDLSSFGTVTNSFVYVTTSGSLAAIGTEFPSLSGASILETNTMNLNGDDRVRIILTSDSTVIDQFGAEGIDGSGELWEYTDSFAKRLNGTGPDGGFNETNWSFGGPGALDTFGVCQGGSDTFEILIGGVGTYSTAPVVDPTINIVGGGITNLDYFEGNGPSNEGDFSISGINLNGNITVAAPANFEVSLTSGSGFGPSVVLTETAGEVASTTVYVRLAAGLGVNTYNGDVTASSTGAADATISVGGTVAPADPQISVFGTVNSLSYQVGTGPSAEDDFFVEGLFLSENITITAPANFEVSLTSGSGFGPSVSVAQTAGTAPNTPVYVRLAAGLAEGPYSGDISISSAGVTPQTIALSGTVFGPPTNALILTGVFDGPLTGGTPKGVEIFVSQNIPDLSLFGLGSANNGGGTDGEEFSFPAVIATAGTYIYVASEATEFEVFFGFAPDFTTSEMGINGDDAIELFENGSVIDTFGTIDCDPNAAGTTCPEWEYTDGWAYRVDNTGPDGTNFVLANWTFSGVNELEGGTTNAETTSPFPIGTYTRPLSNSDFTSTNFSLYPNPVTNGSVTISSNSADAMQVQVYDVLGKVVKSETLSSNTLDVSNLNTGLYIVKITQNQNSVTKKLVIR